MNVPLVDLLQNLAKTGNSQFASFTYTDKKSGGTSRYNVTLGFSYLNAVENSKLELELAKPSLSDPTDILAANELLESFGKTLDGTQDGYTKAETYADTAIKGLKVNTVDGSLQLFGLVNSKVVLVPGVHKEVKSAPKTIAKNRLRKMLAIGKFREFAIDEGHFLSARLNGDTIEFDAVPA